MVGLCEPDNETWFHILWGISWLAEELVASQE